MNNYGLSCVFLAFKTCHFSMTPCFSCMSFIAMDEKPSRIKRARAHLWPERLKRKVSSVLAVLRNPKLDDRSHPSPACVHMHLLWGVPGRTSDSHLLLVFSLLLTLLQLFPFHAFALHTQSDYSSTELKGNMSWQSLLDPYHLTSVLLHSCMWSLCCWGRPVVAKTSTVAWQQSEPQISLIVTSQFSCVALLVLQKPSQHCI